MLNRYNFFLANNKGKEKDIYFESQAEIAKLINVSEKTVNRCIQTLKEKGYLTYKLIRRGTVFNNSYIVNDIHGISPLVEKPKEKVKPVVIPKKIKVNEDIEQPSWA